MSSCLSGGGGRTYALDFEIVKSPCTSTRTTHSSSPSSTLSESSNSPLVISTRKPRTPRKRPNQTYNEAAALLSTANPSIFSTKHFTKASKFSKQHDSVFDDSSELLLPFRVIDSSGFLLQQPIQEKPSFQIQPKVASNFCEKPCQSPGEVDFQPNSLELCDGYEEDFDAESMLDEEIEEGIDSIMGNLSVSTDVVDESNGGSYCNIEQMNYWYGNSIPMGFNFGGKFESGFGMRRGGVTALRHMDEGNWWRFPIVDMLQISPKFHKASVSSKKKKKKVEKPATESKSMELPKENSIPKPNSGLILKLNFDEVLNAWSDKGSPFSDEILGSSEVPANDVSARLAQIDLFSDGGGFREASVLRYKEKRRTRLFSKKIRYQVRKVNADRRPRMKGRFVRRPNSSTSGQR